jgi:putative sporulation protein YtaF
VLWLSAALIAAVSNLDNLAVGTAFGMRDRRVSAGPNLIIATVTMATTAGAITFGRTLSQTLAPSVGSALGSAIIIAVGAGTVITALSSTRRPERSPTAAEAPVTNLTHRDGLSPREALAVGVALSMNNLGTGVGAGVAGIPALATTLLAGVFSLLAVGGGSRIGWSLGRAVFGRGAPLIAGLVLLAVGGATLTGAG